MKIRMTGQISVQLQPAGIELLRMLMVFPVPGLQPGGFCVKILQQLTVCVFTDFQSCVKHRSSVSGLETSFTGVQADGLQPVFCVTFQCASK